MSEERNNNSGGILGLLGIAALIASWFFIFIIITSSNVILWEEFLRFWQRSPRFDTLDTWMFLVMFLVPLILALIALPAFFRSSYFQTRIPAFLGALILLASLILRFFPVAENDLQRGIFRFLTDTGLVEVGLGFFLFLGGTLLVLFSAIRAKA